MKKSINYYNIFTAVKWTLIIAFFAWVICSYAEIMNHRYDEAYDYGFNFVYKIIELVR